MNTKSSSDILIWKDLTNRFSSAIRSGRHASINVIGLKKDQRPDSWEVLMKGYCKIVKLIVVQCLFSWLNAACVLLPLLNGTLVCLFTYSHFKWNQTQWTITGLSSLARQTSSLINYSPYYFAKTKIKEKLV